MNSEQLSQRLNSVAEAVNKYGTLSHTLADIGSDHAYLPCYLVHRKYIDSAIAGEVALGPYNSAVNEVNNEHLSNKISVRLGDGLEVIQDDEDVNIITICGMGGTLIRRILEEGKAKLINKPLLILQPNIGEFQVRDWLIQNHYHIIEEKIIYEHHHFYEIIIAKAMDELQHLSKEELEMGPVLLQRKDDVFYQKWHNQLKAERNILESMLKSSSISAAKISAQRNRIQMIEEAIDEENNSI